MVLLRLFGLRRRRRLVLHFDHPSVVFADPPDLECCIEDEPGRGRPPKPDVLKPLAPFDSDPGRALLNVIDRVTGDSIPSDTLKTYAETLFQYHLSSEDKFDNGQFLDSGRTVRRHVVATSIGLIGKEANRVGESGESDPAGRSATFYWPQHE